jgi:hypothetical protein
MDKNKKSIGKKTKTKAPASSKAKDTSSKNKSNNDSNVKNTDSNISNTQEKEIKEINDVPQQE